MNHDEWVNSEIGCSYIEITLPKFVVYITPMFGDHIILSWFTSQLQSDAGYELLIYRKKLRVFPCVS